MTPLSNQLPYTPIEPLAQPKAGFSVLMMAVQRVAFFALFTVYAALSGGAFGLMGWTKTIASGVLSGGVIGLIGSIARGFFIPFPGVAEDYRIGTLAQLESAIQNPRALVALQNLKSFLHYPLKRFSRPFDYALFHSELSAVTKKLDRERPDTIAVWLAFLRHLHGTELRLPGGEVVTLDCSQEWDSSAGEAKQKQVEISWITGMFAFLDDASLSQIEAIQKITLSPCEIHPKEALREIFRKRCGAHCVVARDPSTRDIAGFGWYLPTERGIEIKGLCRKPEFARVGIGPMLIQEMLRQFKNPQVITVCLRKSNPAIRLFAKFGFECTQQLPNHYKRHPKEDGAVLTLNWDKYTSILNRR